MEIGYKGYAVNINEKLLDKQRAWGNIKEILCTRIEIQNLLYFEADDIRHGRWGKELAQTYLKDLTELEYRLQRAWNFPEDENYHSYQYELSGCICPTMDNYERLGTPYKIVTKGCLYHDKDA